MYLPVGGRRSQSRLGRRHQKDGVLPSPRLPLLAEVAEVAEVAKVAKVAKVAEVAEVARHATSRVPESSIESHSIDTKNPISHPVKCQLCLG